MGVCWQVRWKQDTGNVSAPRKLKSECFFLTFHFFRYMCIDSVTKVFAAASPPVVIQDRFSMRLSVVCCLPTLDALCKETKGYSSGLQFCARSASSSGYTTLVVGSLLLAQSRWIAQVSPCAVATFRARHHSLLS